MASAVTWRPSDSMLVNGTLISSTFNPMEIPNDDCRHNSNSSNSSGVPNLPQTAFRIVDQLRQIWSKLNTTLLIEEFNPIITEFVELTYSEFTKPNAWTKPFSM